jgi:copper/silver efflux system protein
VVNAALVAIVGLLLAFEWLPLGAQHPTLANVAFVALAMGGLLGGFKLFTYRYASMLNWFLSHRAAFLGPFVAIILLGATVWLGFGRVFFFLPRFVRSLPPVVALNHSFPGLGKEFMPRLDEGSFLFMPTTMAHASLGAAAEMLRTQDMAIRAVPEVEIVVGKLGRAESALDPAPTSMFETVITLKPEYVVDEKGRRIRFAYDRETDAFQRDSSGALIPDKRGRPYRNWRDHIRSTDDIWDEITAAAKVVGVTGAPKLQPIEARVVMLQSGMRAPMGIKIKGPDLATIERTGLDLERLLKQVPSVDPASVIADRVVGKPYLEIHIDRDAIARYGLTVQAVQDVIEFAAGGKPITTTVEGRERYNVRVRYPRELRGTPETLMRILVPTMNGAQVPLGQLARIEYRRGPEMFKGEETFLTSYVLFKKRDGHAEVNVVEDAQALLADRAASGDLSIPPGVTYEFAGSYRNQLRAQRTLSVVLPFALLLIFLILYLQFRRVQTTAFVFSGILLTWAGGFILIWLYGQSWFLDFAVFGVNLRELFQIRPINLSVAVWVGFLALFGIATDDAVLMCTYLDQQFSRSAPRSIQEIRRLTIQAAVRRVRPALMTSATTILALLAILTSTGRGAEVMIPMAIPSFGGMILELATIFQAPILYSLVQERKLRRRGERDA